MDSFTIDCQFFDAKAFLRFIHSDEKVSDEIYPNQKVWKIDLGNGIICFVMGLHGTAPMAPFAITKEKKLLWVKDDAFDASSLPLAFPYLFSPKMSDAAWRKQIAGWLFCALKDILFSDEYLNWMKSHGLLSQYKKVMLISSGDFFVDHPDVWQDPDWIFKHPEKMPDPPGFFQFSLGEIVSSIMDKDAFIEAMSKEFRNLLLTHQNTDHGLIQYFYFMIREKFSTDVMRAVLNGKLAESAAVRNELLTVIPANSRKISVFYEDSDGTERFATTVNPISAMIPYSRNAPFFLGIRVIPIDAVDPCFVPSTAGWLVPWNRIIRVEHCKRIIWEKH